MPFHVSAILLDIEGTTSSIRFVYDTMFPYVREHLASFLEHSWNEPAVRRAAELIARDAGGTSLEAWAGSEPKAALERVREQLITMMDKDVKATGLKELQGLIWTDGFTSGAMVAHVFPDVPPAIREWNARGIDIRIYSSGSVTAQKQFFGHTEAGDLLPLFKGHYDTTTGPKREARSYAAIAADMKQNPERILFLSDVPAELDAARAAGFETGLLVRPGNSPVGADHGHRVYSSFAEIVIESGNQSGKQEA